MYGEFVGFFVLYLVLAMLAWLKCPFTCSVIGILVALGDLAYQFWFVSADFQGGWPMKGASLMVLSIGFVASLQARAARRVDFWDLLTRV